MEELTASEFRLAPIVDKLLAPVWSNQEVHSHRKKYYEMLGLCRNTKWDFGLALLDDVIVIINLSSTNIENSFDTVINFTLLDQELRSLYSIHVITEFLRPGLPFVM
ncbi:hypothetical protein MJO29_007181 [Puccinia striiformis f. sp. tritici]|uniref:hypothetical protein n=1 Tax=Puccinia striiformis f. sp. tritici TaxID=168172 RepID=UPI002007BC56|nr:hypothetical protein Pst134EA_013312 [Puccinia striiformis f. sp. tritici]XP_047806182.1 hypothetical protein Pst134EA_013344 [Puccinia striiformis f. sp. tritici]KAI9603716.1 hypothetical protein H4Q26_003315 [Puccinia striiformis f. sp. tritici PST-130]KAH9454216.1 hypothetical protein Pst134EB_014310 [Puccinia striiformis f. sp. tritici]KAH9465428.1 hypothetical protein Pst134EA_013312 [Puccinia striiformis f. sp. tritici]KAH9465461.1 hypothetical protein Pst134EA_013344 [Puccinia striif